MVVEAVHYATIALTLASAIAAAEIKDLTKAILAFTSMSVFLAAIFYILGAPYVAIFQLSIYAGAVTVMLLAALHTGGEK